MNSSDSDSRAVLSLLIVWWNSFSSFRDERTFEKSNSWQFGETIYFKIGGDNMWDNFKNIQIDLKFYNVPICMLSQSTMVDKLKNK